MSEASNEGLYVAAGTHQPLGDGDVAVMGVANNPVRASVSVVGTAAGTQYEATHVATNGQEISVGPRRFSVGVSEVVAGVRGGVSFTPLEQSAPPAAADMVTLDAHDGALRLNGPDLTTATEVRVVGWEPDELHPSAATLEWWPGLLPRDYAKAPDLQTAKLAAGQRVTLGATSADIVAIEGATAAHPARIVLRLLPKP